MTTSKSATPLRDVLYAFSLAKPVPDARLLDEFVGRYPEYAAEIEDFAIEVAVDAARGEDTEAQDMEAKISPAVSRAMSRFQNRLYAIRQGGTSDRDPADSLIVSSSVENPFAALDRTAFRQLASRLDANTLFVGKLRDRQIDPNTMTAGFRNRIAQELDVPLDAIVAHFTARTEIHGGQFYKAEQKPNAMGQQSFEEAVRSSGLTEEQQRRLMSM